MKFYQACNNSVYAVISEDTERRLEERMLLHIQNQKAGLPPPVLVPVKPIFTFSDEKHPSFRFMTGSLDCMDYLLKGHEVINDSFYVPFSNGTEIYRDPQEQKLETEFCTNLSEAMSAFGLDKRPCETKESVRT